MFITGSVMLSTMIVALDGTIANVALPHMQSSLMAAPEQVVWVLTSYLMASAIMTPLASWLASRYGRKRVMLLSAAWFTIASLACGLAVSLPMMVIARIVQGIAGAGLIPLGQSTLLDIYPPEKQGQAMAMAGLGAMFGPLTGPTLGGFLTDAFTWRWVFLINIPIGVLATAGILFAHFEARDKEKRRFDLFGFAAFSVFLAAFQLMMDRGQQQDWFESREIWIEATVMMVCAYLTIVHMFTARNTFVRAEVFADRNFSLGSAISAVIGVVIFASVPLLTVMMQTLLGYTAFLTGLVSLPRGVGTILGLLAVTRLLGRVDARNLLLIGLAMCASGLYLFTTVTLETDQLPLMVGGFLQGAGGGLMIAPLSSLVFATMKPHLRNEGAALYALFRNMGNSIGISALQVYLLDTSALSASRMVEGVRPDNPVVEWAMPDMGFEMSGQVAAMTGEVWRQATMVATLQTLQIALMVTLASLPAVLLLRTKKPD